MVDNEPRYTLDEARQKIAEEQCRAYSHDLEEVRTGGRTIAIFCTRCHASFAPEPPPELDHGKKVAMTDRIAFRHRAENNTRFASDAFDSQIGKTMDLVVGPTSRRIRATLIAAQVADDGQSVFVTLALPEGEHIDVAEILGYAGDTGLSFRPWDNGTT